MFEINIVENNQIISISIIIICIIIYFFGDARSFDMNGKRLPGPDSNFYGKNIFSVIKAARKKKQASFAMRDILINEVGDGKLSCCRVGNLRYCFVADPEYVKVVMSGKHDMFPKSVRYERMKFALGNGLVTSNGNDWKKDRQLINPGFHAGALKNMVISFNDKSRIMIDYLKNILIDDKITSEHVVKIDNDNMHLDFSHFMPCLTLSIICQTGFSYSYDFMENNESNFSGMLNLVLDEINHRLEELWEYQYIFYRERQNKIKEPFARFDILLNNIVSDRMKTRSKDDEIKDLLDILISATNGDDSLSLDNMKDQIMTFIGAGHETTSTTLMWIFYELSKHPDILLQITQEVDEILGKGANKKTEVAYDDINKFTYMSQVIKETLRMHPSIPALGRVNKEEFQFGEYRMHPNTNIIVSIFALHYNKDYWVEPYVFNPDRFHPDKTLKMHPFQFVAFSAGPRNCIGQRFANMELVVVLALFLSNFEISMNDDDFNYMSIEETIVLQPRNIWGNFKLRNQ